MSLELENGMWNSFSDKIGLIHDSWHVGFQIVMQISHVLCWGQTLEKRQIAENRLVEILK